MMQCELEYMRTRTVLPIDEAEVFRELEEIARWLEDFFVRKGIATERGTYSKLSFLRDAAAAGVEWSRS